MSLDDATFDRSREAADGQAPAGTCFSAGMSTGAPSSLPGGSEIAASGSVAASDSALSATPDDLRLMGQALNEARLAAAEGEVPIGAVVVCDGEVVSRAHNRRELDLDPSAHAEFRAMVDASRALGRWRLTGCTVYVTVEPCLMCAGLMVNARIDRCVYGAPDPKGGAVGSLYDVSHDSRLNHEFEVTSGVRADECAQVMRDFFRARRAQRKAARKAERASGGNQQHIN